MFFICFFCRQKLKADKQIPDMNALKVAADAAVESGDETAPNPKEPKKAKIPSPSKPLLTDEQIDAALLKKDKETARRKQDFAWQEAELLDQINKHERKLGAHPLGRDRAYRRYWIFPTVSGVFVEHDDQFVGPCLPTPTQHIGEVNFEDLTFIKEHFDKVGLKLGIFSIILFCLYIYLKFVRAKLFSCKKLTRKAVTKKTQHFLHQRKHQKRSQLLILLQRKTSPVLPSLDFAQERMTLVQFIVRTYHDQNGHFSGTQNILTLLLMV